MKVLTALKTPQVSGTVLGDFPSWRAVECDALNALPVQTQMLLVFVFVGRKLTRLWGEKSVLRAVNVKKK